MKLLPAAIASEPVVGIPEVPTDIGEEASGDEGQSSCSTSSSSSSSESSSSDGDARPLAKRARVSAAVPNRIDAEGGWVVHRRSQILHRVYREKILVCGRPRTPAYKAVEDVTRMGNLVCKTCQRNSS